MVCWTCIRFIQLERSVLFQSHSRWLGLSVFPRFRIIYFCWQAFHMYFLPRSFDWCAVRIALNMSSSVYRKVHISWFKMMYTLICHKNICIFSKILIYIMKIGNALWTGLNKLHLHCDDMHLWSLYTPLHIIRFLNEDGFHRLMCDANNP